MKLFRAENKKQNISHFSACGIVEIENKILLVRHTYGAAKDRILLPGGYVKEKEMPTNAIEREILEETGVICKAKELYAMQFKNEQWLAIFTMEYISGKPISDGYENSEVLLLSVDEALEREDLTNLSREILKTYKKNKNGLVKSNYIANSCTEEDFAIFGI